MKISARNQLKGTVAAVEKGAVNGIVKIDLGGTVITADITNASIDELGLEPGKEALAIIKATEVMFANAAIAGISARNQLTGTVAEVEKGAVNGRVVLELAGGAKVSGTITNAAIDELGLEAGKEAVAIVKSTSVMVGIE